MSATPLARIDDIADGAAIVVTHGARSILIARRAATVFAYENRCSHADYPFEREDGSVLVQEQRFIVCPHHGASYALDTGACAGGPCNGAGLAKIAVELRDGAILIRE